MEQTLWFFKLPLGRESRAVEIADKLADKEPSPIELPSLPIDSILKSLKGKFKKLKLDSKLCLGELDLPSRETFLTLSWGVDFIKATFEGDGEKTMEEVAMMLAKLECGCVYGNEYFPPSAPYGSDLWFQPDIDAMTKIGTRITRQVRKKFPNDAKTQRQELDRIWRLRETYQEIDDLADKMERDYRLNEPPDIVARTEIVRMPHLRKWYWSNNPKNKDPNVEAPPRPEGHPLAES